MTDTMTETQELVLFYALAVFGFGFGFEDIFLGWMRRRMGKGCEREEGRETRFV